MSSLNDPRVLFAAERTLLAWGRTSLALMAFGFAVERFGLVAKMFAPDKAGNASHTLSFFVGLGFVAAGVLTCAGAVAQYRRFVKTLNADEVPVGYSVHFVAWTNTAIALLGIALTAYLFVEHAD